MEHETATIADENAIPAHLKGKNGPRRPALGSIPLTGRENVSCKPVADSGKAGDCQSNAMNPKIRLQALQPSKAAPGKGPVPRNPSVIVKPVNGTTTIATAPTPATEFSIFCDESCDSDSDSQDVALDLSLTSVGGKGDEGHTSSGRKNDSVCEVFEAVGVHDRVLKELNLDSSLISSDASPDFATPCSMRTAGKSTALMSSLDMSIDAENIEPVHKKGRPSTLNPVVQYEEYVDDVLKYLMKMEKEHAVDPEYLSQQPDINARMRMVLVDWLVEVADEYKLDDETLFLSVGFMDRFLSKQSIAKHSFQLLGTSCLFIAAKYEEIYPPDVNEFVHVTDETYDKTQVLKMEILILKTLHMNVSTPTTHYFLRRLTSNSKASPRVIAMSEYLCYLAMLCGGSLMYFYPSEIAFSSVILAAHTLGEEDQLCTQFLTQTLQSMTDSMPETDDEKPVKEDLKQRLNDCLNELLTVQKSASSLANQSVLEKFRKFRYFGVADMACLESAPVLN